MSVALTLPTADLQRGRGPSAAASIIHDNFRAEVSPGGTVREWYPDPVTGSNIVHNVYRPGTADHADAHEQFKNAYTQWNGNNHLTLHSGTYGSTLTANPLKPLSNATNKGAVNQFVERWLPRTNLRGVLGTIAEYDGESIKNTHWRFRHQYLQDRDWPRLGLAIQTELVSRMLLDEMALPKLETSERRNRRISWGGSLAPPGESAKIEAILNDAMHGPPRDKFLRLRWAIIFLNKKHGTQSLATLASQVRDPETFARLQNDVQPFLQWGMMCNQEPGVQFAAALAEYLVVAPQNELANMRTPQFAEEVESPASDAMSGVLMTGEAPFWIEAGSAAPAERTQDRPSCLERYLSALEWEAIWSEGARRGIFIGPRVMPGGARIAWNNR